jgi:hypothetical protein
MNDPIDPNRDRYLLGVAKSKKLFLGPQNGPRSLGPEKL